MAKLIYMMPASLDGYVEDQSGKFGWAEPDEEVHLFVNRLARDQGTYLYGRRMYETMVFWETAEEMTEESPALLEWARQWKAAEKIVFSSTLTNVQSQKTRIEKKFDADLIRRLKAESERDISISGPELAAEALRAGLVDEIGMVVFPVVVGGGKPFFPPGLRLDLRRTAEREVGEQVVYLEYAVEGVKADPGPSR